MIRLKRMFIGIVLLAGLAFPTLVFAAAAREGSPWMDFIYKTINFIVLVGLLFYFLRKPIPAFLRQAAQSLHNTINGTRQATQNAAAELDGQKSKIANLQAELDSMLAEAREDARRERERLVAEAGERAIQLKAQVQVQVEQELRKARLELQQQLARQTTELAYSLVSQRMSAEKQQQLMSGYVDRLEARS